MKFLIVAGDPSGSIHATRLMREILDKNPTAAFYGIGGDDMIAAGLMPLANSSDVAVVGFWEVAKRYFFFRNLLGELSKSLLTERPDAFIAVDYPGFNLRLAAAAKKVGIPVIYYIAPQLWAWGQSRASKMEQCVDLLLTVFPFETEFFSQLNIRAEFVGHPLLDCDNFADIKGNGWNKRLIALLPGSRAQEVERNLPVMLEACGIFNDKHPGFEFACAIVPSVKRNIYEDIVRKIISKSGKINIEFVDDSRLLMEDARAGLIKAGTSTLEACLSNLPFAAMYRASLGTYFFGKMAAKTKFLSMPNILAGREISREFIQWDATPQALGSELVRLVFDEEARRFQQGYFVKIREELGGGGASRRAAGRILNWLSHNKRDIHA